LPADNVVSGDGRWCLADAGKEYLVYTAQANSPLQLQHIPAGKYRLRWIDPRSGRETDSRELVVDDLVRLSAKSKVLWISSDRSD
jgi:hypothetical protein